MTAFQMSKTQPVIFPVHPRTRAKFVALGLPSSSTPSPITTRQFDHLTTPHSQLVTIPPLSFLDMVQLEKNARAILTDSGGVQKEAYFHGVPCVTLRDETEWVETVQAGWNQVVGANSDMIIDAIRKLRFGDPIPEYGRGSSANDLLGLLCQIISFPDSQANS